VSQPPSSTENGPDGGTPAVRPAVVVGTPDRRVTPAPTVTPGWWRARAGIGSRRGTTLGVGLVTLYLSLVVLIPLAAVIVRSQTGGFANSWRLVTASQPLAALKLTVIASVLIAIVNLVMGTIIAWVLVRDDFPGKGVVDMVIDMPFALPTIVAGLVLLTLYGPSSPLHVNIAFTRLAIVVALLFVTLPFVVRTVQPVLLELDRDMEAAAASLGASNLLIARKIILPNLIPAMLTGTGLAFARAIGEFGSVNLLSGNLPFHTEVSAVNIYNQIQSDNNAGAAAQSTVLLILAFLVLFGLDLIKRRGGLRGER
jgi:sulfate transport system permease protein